MAFPAIQDADTTSGERTTNAATWTFTYPSNIANGNKLVLLVSRDGFGTADTLPAGWSEAKRVTDFADITLWVFEKDADGTETGTFDITFAQMQKGCWRCYRITGHLASTAIAVSAGVTGLSTGPDPDNLNIGSAEDILWIAAHASDHGDTTTTGFPANYTNGVSQEITGDFQGTGLGIARRNLNAAAENPGAFTTDRSEQWASLTVGIRPLALAARRARLYGFEFQTSSARLNVSWIEFEVPPGQKRRRIGLPRF